MKQPTFAIYTLGCKLNYSESSDLSRQLISAGFSHSEFPDYMIINSCAVTAAAEKKVRNLVSHLHRQYPDSRIVVAGCYAALRPKEIMQWPGVVATFGSEDKMNVIPFLKGEELPCHAPFFPAFSFNDRTRSFLKIQDGCDYHCTYCTVWRARGESRSDSIEHVLQEIEEIKSLGINEINLTGVNLGDFGSKNGSSFYELLQAIEKQNSGVRIRISSIEPNLLTDEMIELSAGSRMIMPHFHIPLQSANNRVLGLMHRRYRRELYEHKVMKIKELMPHACIAMDIIAGFPTETEAEFAEGLDFLHSLPISYMHVFTYSRRPNTPAAEMDGLIPPPVKKERTNRLIALSEEKKHTFYHSHLGETHPVLLEAEEKNNCMFGFTDNYIKVKIPFDEQKINTIQNIVLTEENLEFA